MLTLLTFGTLSLQNGNQITTGAGAQRSRLAILAVLAVAGPRGVSRDKLLGYFWADVSEERARHALKQACYALRRSAGADLFVNGGGMLALNPAVITSDVSEFEAAVASGDFGRAVAVYKGAFLDGVYVRDAEAFESWADTERRRLAAQFESALEQLANAAEREQKREEAVKWRRRLATHDPLSSRAAAGLMRALADSGDLSAALQHARIYEALVADELQGKPDPVVAELTAKLRSEQAARPNPASGPVLTAALSEWQQDPPAHVSSDARRAPPGSRRPIAIAAALTAVGVAVSVAALASSRDVASVPRGAVAITSFANLTGDSTLSILGATISNRLADDLTHASVPGLELAGKAKPAIVVSGALYRRGDTLALQTRIADTRSGKAVIAVEPVLAPASAPERLYERTSERVLGALAVLIDTSVTRGLDVTTRPPTLSAYREYSAGLEERSNQAMVKAADHFEQAFAIDSDFAPALLYAAISLQSMGRLGRSDSILRTLESLRDRLSRQDRLGLSFLVASGRGDHETALAFVRRASDLAPDSYWAQSHASYALHVHHAAEALRVATRTKKRGSHQDYRPVAIAAYHRLGNHRAEYALARMLGHDTRSGLGALGISAAAAGDTAKVSELVRTILGLPGQADWKVVTLRSLGAELRVHGYPMAAGYALKAAANIYEAVIDTGAYGHLGRLDYARALEGLGRIEDAKRHYEALAALPISAEAVGRPLLTYRIMINARGHLGALEARRGNRVRAEEEIRALQSLESRYRAVNPAHAGAIPGEHQFQEAVIVAALGRRAEALTLLHIAFAAGYRHPWLDAHRGYLPEMTGYPPFEAFMRPGQSHRSKWKSSDK